MMVFLYILLLINILFFSIINVTTDYSVEVIKYQGLSLIEKNLFNKYGMAFSYPNNNNSFHIQFFTPNRRLPSMNYIITPNISGWVKLHILMVCTASQSSWRSFVREHYSISNVRITFIMMDIINYRQIINDENRIYGDILLIDHKNQYWDLTILIYYSLAYVSRYHHHSEYIMKTDIDCVIQLEKLLQLLSNYHSKSIFMGTCNTHYISIENDIPLKFNNPLYWNNGAGYILLSEDIPYVVMGFKYSDFVSKWEDKAISRVVGMLNITCERIDHFWDQYQESSTQSYIIHTKGNFERYTKYYNWVYRNITIDEY